MPRAYLPLLQELDQWQAEARREHPGVIPCRQGCSACCHGPFDISVADVALLVEAVTRLPDPVRRGVVAKAHEQVGAMLAIVPDWQPPYAIDAIGDDRFDELSDALETVPCPLLDAAGGCLAYERRPMLCRLIGLGLAAESGAVIENACPIQHRHPDYAALPPRPFRLDAFERDEERLKRAAAKRLFDGEDGSSYETTVAGAIVAWVGA